MHRLPLIQPPESLLVPSLDEASGPRDLMQVGDLAQETGKTVRAIHLYEELGLLTPAARSKGRYRLYGAEALIRIRWIGKLQDLGFSLADIQTIVRDWERAGTAPDAMTRDARRLRPKLEETRAQLAPPRRRSSASSKRASTTSTRATRLRSASASSRACRCVRPARRSEHATCPSSSPGFRAQLEASEHRHGHQAPHLHGLPLDDAGRPARARGDAAVLHREVRQRRQPQPRLRLDGGRGRRLRPRADRGAHRRAERQGDRLHLAAPPRATTSPSRAWPSSTRTRATTSSPR